MTSQEPLIRDVSDTALWVAAYRAEESERPDALFRDPLSGRLAGARGFEIARRVKQPAVRTGVILRTAVMDAMIVEAVRERGADTVLNLAAGLDCRPYRLELPAGLRWIEADLPGLIEDKDRALADERPRCRLERVSADLADREAAAGVIESAASGSRRVLAVSEGFLGYLEPDVVGGLAAGLRAQPAVAEWVTELIGAHVASRVRNAGDELKADGARVIFAPEEGTAFFGPFGWSEAEYRDVFYEGPRLGRDSAVWRAVRLVARLMPPDRRARLERGLGVVRLERAA